MENRVYHNKQAACRAKNLMNAVGILLQELPALSEAVDKEHDGYNYILFNYGEFIYVEDIMERSGVVRIILTLLIIKDSEGVFIGVTKTDRSIRGDPLVWVEQDICTWYNKFRTSYLLLEIFQMARLTGSLRRNPMKGSRRIPNCRAENRPGRTRSIQASEAHLLIKSIYVNFVYELLYYIIIVIITLFTPHVKDRCLHLRCNVGRA